MNLGVVQKEVLTFDQESSLTLGPTRRFRGMGAGWNPSPEFLIYCVFRNDFTFSGKPLIFLKEMRYILWVRAPLEAGDVTNNSRHLGYHLGSYQELEIRLKLREMVIV